jgi:hypothetical protein
MQREILDVLLSRSKTAGREGGIHGFLLVVRILSKTSAKGTRMPFKGGAIASTPMAICKSKATLRAYR